MCEFACKKTNTSYSRYVWWFHAVLVVREAFWQVSNLSHARICDIPHKSLWWLSHLCLRSAASKITNSLRDRLRRTLEKVFQRIVGKYYFLWINLYRILRKIIAFCKMFLEEWMKLMSIVLIINCWNARPLWDAVWNMTYFSATPE